MAASKALRLLNRRRLPRALGPTNLGSKAVV